MNKLIISLALLSVFSGSMAKNNSEQQPSATTTNKQMTLNISKFKWTRQPNNYSIKGDTIEVVTKSKTGLWQRTYYHFRNDNASVFQTETKEKMRICHLHKGNDKISFGIYACSPEASSFKAFFTDMKITECAWKAHDGQQPD